MLEERIGFLMKTKAGTMPGYERYNVVVLEIGFSFEFKEIKRKVNIEGPLYDDVFLHSTLILAHQSIFSKAWKGASEAD